MEDLSFMSQKTLSSSFTFQYLGHQSTVWTICSMSKQRQTYLGPEYFFIGGIYGLINSEPLCLMKSLTDLSSTQFHNCWSNSIIFKYAVSAAGEHVQCVGLARCATATIRLASSQVSKCCRNLEQIS